MAPLEFVMVFPALFALLVMIFYCSIVVFKTLTNDHLTNFYLWGSRYPETKNSNNRKLIDAKYDKWQINVDFSECSLSPLTFENQGKIKSTSINAIRTGLYFDKVWKTSRSLTNDNSAKSSEAYIKTTSTHQLYIGTWDSETLALFPNKSDNNSGSFQNMRNNNRAVFLRQQGSQLMKSRKDTNSTKIYSSNILNISNN